MTTAAAAPPQPKDAIRIEKADRLPWARIHPSKTNPRTHFDDAYIKDDLAVSIREKGIIQPIIVRPHPRRDDDVEIVAGECRWRAAKVAGLELLPVIIREYTDEQVLEIQIEENTHRKNLTPLEEAAAYRRLINVNPDKHSAATIASRIGMSVTYVWDYLKLNDLIPEAKAILERELMAVGHAILIARLKPADQERVIDPGDGRNGFNNHRDGLWQYDGGWLRAEDDDDLAAATEKDKYHGVKAVSVRELEKWIKEHIRFDVAHAAKAQPLAFEHVAAAVAQAEAEPGRGKKVIPITFSYRVADDARDDKERTYGRESWERADGQEKSKACEHSVLGTVVAGTEHYGETFTVCIARDKCRVHFGKVIAAKEKAAKLREAGKPKQAKKVEESWEARHAREQAEERAEQERWKQLQPHAVAAIVSAIKPSKLTNAILSDVIRERMDGYNGRSLAAVEKLLGGKVTIKNFTRALVLAEVVKVQWSRHHTAALAKRYKVDLAKLEKTPEPKAPAAPAKRAS